MTASTKDSTFLLFMSSYHSQLSNKCKEIASKSNRDDYGNENVKSNGFYEPKNSFARASHFLVPFAPGYQREESLGTIYIKEHELFTIKWFTPFHLPKLQKMSDVVRGDVRFFCSF